MATKYTREILQNAVDNSTSYAGVLRYLGLRQAGGTQTHIAKQIKRLNIDTAHFTGGRWNKGGVSPTRKTADQILIVLPEGSNRAKAMQLRRAMIDGGLTYQCQCGIIDIWQGTPIVLEIDHIDGNCLNNRIENLRFLCPNCHSQQDTNKSHKYKVMPL